MGSSSGQGTQGVERDGPDETGEYHKLSGKLLIGTRRDIDKKNPFLGEEGVEGKRWSHWCFWPSFLLGNSLQALSGIHKEQRCKTLFWMDFITPAVTQCRLPQGVFLDVWNPNDLWQEQRKEQRHQICQAYLPCSFIQRPTLSLHGGSTAFSVSLQELSVQNIQCLSSCSSGLFVTFVATKCFLLCWLKKRMQKSALKLVLCLVWRKWPPGDWPIKGILSSLVGWMESTAA